MFGTLSDYLKNRKGGDLDKITERIHYLDYVVRSEIGRGGIKPRRLTGWLLRKNDVLASRTQGLSDFEIMFAYRGSYIVNNYKFKDEIVRRAETMESAKKCEESAAYREFRGCFLVYLLDFDRFPERGIWANSRRGAEETYDHTRARTKGGRYFGKVEYGTKRTPPTGNLKSRGVNNCAEADEVDNDWNFKGYWDYRLYQGYRPLCQVSHTEQDSASELECADIESWKANRDVGNYYVIVDVAGGYRDDERTGCCDGFKTFDMSNVDRVKYRRNGRSRKCSKSA